MRANASFRDLLREPLVHLLALGALIFGANAVLHRSVRDNDPRITITKTDVDRLRALHSQQWGAEPAPAHASARNDASHAPAGEPDVIAKDIRDPFRMLRRTGR